MKIKKKHFIACFFVLSGVFEKYLENSIAFGRAIVREIQLHGHFPRCDNLTHFVFESKLIYI